MRVPHLRSAVFLTLLLLPRPGHAAIADSLHVRSLSAFPIVMYDSDIGIGLGAKSLLRNGFGHDESLDLLVFFSSKGEQWYVLAGSIPDPELRQGRRFAGALDIKLEFDKLLKSNYFGLGNGTDDNEHQFPKEFWTLQLTLGTAPHPRLIGEIVGRLTHYAIYGYDPAWGTITAGTAGAGESFVAAFGARIRWDGRDSSVNPRKGWRVVAGVDLARPEMGSDWRFTVFRLESSLYASLARDHVIAGRWWMQSVDGVAPYVELSKVGDSWTARGFKADRFLDRAMTLSSMEYRFPLYRRLGGVAFVDVGRVWPGLHDLSLRDWHADAGGGLRYYLANFVTRLDVGSSNEGTRIFLQFGHVF